MQIKCIFLVSALWFFGCSSSNVSVSSSQAQVNEMTLVNENIVGAPLIILPTIAEENRVKLSFSSKVSLDVSDTRSDKRALGTSALRLASEPIFSFSFALEKTLRSLGFKIVPVGATTLSAEIKRFELLMQKDSLNITTAQAYVKINFILKDSFGSSLILREYEGSSTSNGSNEQKLGVAINDILSQVSIDKELQTVMASF